MPLCTVLTKCPAPPGPIHAQQGVPSSARAAMRHSMSCTSGHAPAEPPGMIEGPCRAPCSPPETPAPTYRMPAASASRIRHSVSRKSELPPSTIVSPLSSSGSRRAIVSSTGAPARIINMIRRGLRTEATKRSSSWNPSKFRPAPRSRMNLSEAGVSPGTIRS